MEGRWAIEQKRGTWDEEAAAEQRQQWTEQRQQREKDQAIADQERGRQEADRAALIARKAEFAQNTQSFIKQVEGLGTVPETPSDMTDPAALNSWMAAFDDVFSVPDPMQTLGLTQGADGRLLGPDGRPVNPEVASATARYQMWAAQKDTYVTFRDVLVDIAGRKKSADELARQAAFDAANLKTLASQVRLNDAQIAQGEAAQRLASMQFTFQILQSPHLIKAAQQAGLIGMLQDGVGGASAVDLNRMLSQATEADEATVIASLPTAQRWAQMNDQDKMSTLWQTSMLSRWPMEKLIERIMAGLHCSGAGRMVHVVVSGR